MFADFTFADSLGVIGSLCICSAYLAVSLGRVDAERLPYQLINISGAVLLLISRGLSKLKDRFGDTESFHLPQRSLRDSRDEP